MHRSHLFVIVTILAICFAGCSGDSIPVAPTLVGDGASKASELAVARSVGEPAGALQSWEHSSFYQDIVQPCECLGEDVRFFGEVPYRYHQVESSSGNFHYSWQALPGTPNSPLFAAEGLASGKLFLYQHGHPVIETFHLGHGEVRTVVDNELYMASDGTKLWVTFLLHMTTNANGELVVSRSIPFTIVCDH